MYTFQQHGTLFCCTALSIKLEATSSEHMQANIYCWSPDRIQNL